MDYLVGDLQGCCGAFDRLLQRIDFSPSRDHLVVLGDLVNRGPSSLATLQRLRALGNAADCLIGNHDLHLLAVAHGVRKRHPSDTLDDILDSPERDAWIDWLRHRRLAMMHGGWLTLHAGVVPQWDAPTTLALAAEVEAVLRGTDLGGFIQQMYGNLPDLWRDDLQGAERWRLVINALTRMRYCTTEGRLDFSYKERPETAPSGLMPWFDLPWRRTRGTPIAFGHWSALGLIDRPELLGLDTGCVWGGSLTAVRIDGARRELIQVDCAAIR